MSNQHTANHQQAFALAGALRDNHRHESVVQESNRSMDEVTISSVPWKQIHRVDVNHLARHSR